MKSQTFLTILLLMASGAWRPTSRWLSVFKPW